MAVQAPLDLCPQFVALGPRDIAQVVFFQVLPQRAHPWLAAAIQRPVVIRAWPAMIATSRARSACCFGLLDYLMAALASAIIASLVRLWPLTPGLNVRVPIHVSGYSPFLSRAAMAEGTAASHSACCRAKSTAALYATISGRSSTWQPVRSALGMLP